MTMKDDSDEPEPTAEERVEAEALARALEASGPADGAAPADALAAAALLRRAARDPAASAADDRARIAAAASRALPGVDARRPRRRRWLVPALAVPALAAFVLVVSRAQRTADRPAAPPPSPSVALLEAQARAARGEGDSASIAALEQQMRDYRNAYYAALAGRGRR
jgi:hypothetical protein